MWSLNDVVAVALCIISVLVACLVPNINVVLVVSVVCSSLAVYLSFFSKEL